MSILHDQIALVLHAQLKAAGPPEDYECARTYEGVSSCIESLSALFSAQDQLQQALGGKTDFSPYRFMQLAMRGEGG